MIITKKTFYYNFIQTKEEEEASKANKTIFTPHQVTRVLVELRDIQPLHKNHPRCNGYFSMMERYHNPEPMKKTIMHYEVISGKLIVSFNNMFEQVLPYWPMSVANSLVEGHKVNLILYDSTDQANPKRYENDAVYMEILSNHDYSFSCLDLFKDRFLKVGDEIELVWDSYAISFQFKLLGRAF